MARETIAGNSASALARAAHSDPEFSAKSIYNLAIQGDDDARRIFRFVGRCLGIVLSNLVNPLHLPIYVIGGGASTSSPSSPPSLFKALPSRYLFYSPTPPT